MQKYCINRISKSEANEIAQWKYEDEYLIYSMEKTKELMAELLDGSYYGILDKDTLIGFICFGENTQIKEGNEHGAYDDLGFTDIGLGIKPELCGQGMGLAFIKNGIEFAKKELSATKFRLTVASFNKRAIKVYERAGFKVKMSFLRKTDNIEFIVMTCEEI